MAEDLGLTLYAQHDAGSGWEQRRARGCRYYISFLERRGTDRRVGGFGHWRCLHVKRGLEDFLIHFFRQRGDRCLDSQYPARRLVVRGRAANCMGNSKWRYRWCRVAVYFASGVKYLAEDCETKVCVGGNQPRVGGPLRGILVKGGSGDCG
jgi:hypothetical protein